MQTNEITDVLLKHYYPKGRRYCITNYTGCGLSECDVLMVSGAGMVYEYEVKRSHGDFLADFKKVHKHDLLSGRTPPFFNDDGWFTLPNYFYYCSEPHIVPLAEVPAYAGLVHIINDTPIVVKRAPKLHKHKASQRLLLSICQSLTAKLVYGCSFMNYKRKLNLAKS